MTACSYHVMYAFQSEYTLYIFLNVKELLCLKQVRYLNLSDPNGTQIHNHLIRKRKMNHIVKLAK